MVFGFLWYLKVVLLSFWALRGGGGDQRVLFPFSSVPHQTQKKSLLRFFWVSLKPDGRKWSQYWQLNNLKCLLIQKNEYISYVNEKECADATVKNLPFFARFPWQYDGIEAWEQEHLLWWIKPKNSVFLNHLSVPKVGEILGGCDAFCANSTVKILPFFARFPWFFLEID